MESFKSVSTKTSLFLLILISCFLISCSTKKDKTKSTTERNILKSDLKILGLKGKISEIYDKEYDAGDNLGEIKKKNIHLKALARFNEDGNFIQLSYSDTTNMGDFVSMYYYDTNGRVIETTSRAGGFLWEDNKYYYDNKGNQTGFNSVSESGKIEERHIFKNDEKGNKIEELIFDGDSTLQKKLISKYDSLGNEIERIGYNPDGSVANDFTFEYDKNSNLIEEIHKSDGEFTQNTFKYDKYDKYGNWLIKIQKGNLKNNFSPLSITEREIIYFKK